MMSRETPKEVEYRNHLIKMDDEKELPLIKSNETVDATNEQNDNFIDDLLANGDLRAMTELSLCSKKLSEIPKNLAVYMINLTRLDLSNNDLKHFPCSIKILAKLQYLSLNNNFIRDLPETISEMSSLRILQLSGNSLKSLPLNLGDLRALETLVLSCNKLSDLPTCCSKLRKLKLLDLSDNSFKDLPKCILRGMKNLETLDVSRNILTNISTRPASNKLKKLYGRGIGANMKFPMWILTGHAPSLEILELDDTTFKLLDFPDKCTNSKIKNLSMQRCSMYDIFVKELLRTMTALKELKLGNGTSMNLSNTFWTMPVDSLKNPDLVTEMDMRATGLVEICRSIGNFTNLVKLDVGRNAISWLTNEICSLKKLEILLIDANELCEFPHNIGLMKSLKELRASTNHIAELPESFGELTNLTYLDLYGNDFQDIPQDLRLLKNLVGLDLDQNLVETDNLRIEATSYQVLRNSLRNRYQSVGKLRETGRRYEIDADKISDSSFGHSSLESDEPNTQIGHVPYESVEENWDLSDNSDDEYDPTRDDRSRSTKKAIPEYSYTNILVNRNQFCPADLHQLPIRRQVEEMRQRGLLENCPGAVGGQFDDA